MLQIPTDHPYVRHLARPETDTGGRTAGFGGAGPAAEFVTAPDPAGPGVPGRWSPSPALDPSFVDAMADEIAVVHLHFGYEHLTPAEVTGWAARLRDSGRALVVTVHDLDNPHLADQTRHRDCVGAAVAAADHVVTLTAGAAQTIARRWARTATVLPHPHALPLPLVGTRAQPRRTDRPRIGLPFGAVRANVAARQALQLLAGRDDLRVQVRVQQSALDRPAAPGRASEQLPLAEYLRAGARAGRWDLQVVAPGLPEQHVWQWLSSLDALLLPYAWGTHSGWVEACADVGTSVLAPRIGHWHEQQPLIDIPELVGDAVEPDRVLDAAVVRLRDAADPVGGGLLALTREARAEQRRRLHHEHAVLYRAGLDRPT